MKKLTFPSYTLLFFLPFLFGKADLHAQTNETGLLWEITGKGIKKSYLYGTIHIQDKKVFAYDPLVEKKLKSCKAFAMELILDEINQLEVAQSMIMMDHSLDQLLTPAQYATVAAVLKEKTGMELSLFNNVKPFMLYTQLSQTEIPQDMDQPLDGYFLKIARENKMKILAVEKLSEQLAAVNSISEQDQANMLVKMLEDTGSAGTQEFEKLIAMYLEQDLGKMTALADDPGLPKELMEQFLVARNQVMAERISGFMKDQSTFTAIGAAHLGGPTGVIALLRKQGYTLNPVPFAFKN
ncbi:MAG: TraB/GumN family protein [Bacteroidota bacterium]